MAISNEITYRPQDKGKKELFSMLIYRPLAKVLLKLVGKFDIDPASISFTSLFLALISCFLILKGKHLPAVIILNLSYVVDMLDGMYARLKGKASELGAWLDGACDSIKMFSLIICIAHWAMIHPFFKYLAIFNVAMTIYLIAVKKGHTLSKGKVYIGFESFFVVSITIFVFDLRYFMIYMCIMGFLAWQKLFWKRWTN